MDKRIVGVFTAEHEASAAIEELKRHGFRTDDISVIARNPEDAHTILEGTGTRAPEGMASGAATGGVLGGVTGLLIGIGALAIPGIGPIIAAGPIAATLAGAAVGAGTGGLVGGLIGLGIPEDEAESYDRYVGSGHILVMVDAGGEHEQEVHRIFGRYHAVNANYSDREIAEELPEARSLDLREATDDSVQDTVDATFDGSGLEGKNDTGLDTRNASSEDKLPQDRAAQDIHRSGMTGSVEESDALAAADQKDARSLAYSTGTMDAMDTLPSEHGGKGTVGEQIREERRREAEEKGVGEKEG
ncbi:general stress protein [Paenibacillus agri]|uniref:General stress protein n=1 Tax=Paenibacillus agri TaxID=2744309 RepID=A0A850EXE5_9BACL|nr:general stress protein [Paenibacillus agri]NUU63572.1 general stress protein [Paenibacillus agri]